MDLVLLIIALHSVTKVACLKSFNPEKETPKFLAQPLISVSAIESKCWYKAPSFIDATSVHLLCGVTEVA